MNICIRLVPKVHHTPPQDGDMLDIGGLGPCSVTVMIRTGLFPHCRSRLRDTTPAPKELFLLLAENFRKGLLSEDWRLPTLEEVRRMHWELVAADSSQNATPNTAEGSPQLLVISDSASSAPEGSTLCNEGPESKRRRLPTKTARPDPAELIGLDAANRPKAA